MESTPRKSRTLLEPAEESAELPQIGETIRLKECDGNCYEGDQGRVLDVLTNGKLIVVCDKDKDCNGKGPFRCTITNWELVPEEEICK